MSLKYTGPPVAGQVYGLLAEGTFVHVPVRDPQASSSAVPAQVTVTI